MSVLDRSLEPKVERLTDYLTPTEQFFVCNSGATPRIQSGSYELRLVGDGISNDVSLSYDDLLTMPQHTVRAVMECAGNHRSMFRDVMGVELDKRPQVTELMWSTGAIGMAEWRGVPLAHVLEMAGLKQSAYHVCPKGSETDSREGIIEIPMPLSKAMDPDTILALEMNGQPLPPDHGHPVRVIVPGWIGAYSVKWVREIEISTEHLWVTRNTEFYVMMGEDWPVEAGSPAKGAPITEQSLKSALALEWPVSLPAGPHTLRGFARSPGRPIASVHWSDDHGATWNDATLSGPNEKWGWALFEFQWTATPGDHAIMTRATDIDGRTQPMSIPFNTGGYLYNAVHPHPIEVT